MPKDFADDIVWNELSKFYDNHPFLEYGNENSDSHHQLQMNANS